MLMNAQRDLFICLIVYMMRWIFVENYHIGWRSTAHISSPGYTFLPLDYQALFLSEINVSSILTCTRRCHSHHQCRLFDYDPPSTRCRLFQGDLTTMGQLVPSSSSSSRVGSLRITSDQFVNMGQSCSMCMGSRYLMCTNGTCQCPMNTVYDGSICRAQKVAGQSCQNASECHSDMNYVCLPRMQCGGIWIETGIVIGGYGNGTGGSTSNALLYPMALSFDSDGSLYVCDFNNHRVMKLNEGSTIGSLVAGTGVAGMGLNQLRNPSGIYVDHEFNLYIADAFNARVMRWQRNSSVGTIVAGNGTIGNSPTTFNMPTYIVVDSDGNIYVSDYNNGRVMKWERDATSGTMVAGTGIPGSSDQQLNRPYGLYLSEITGSLYIADSLNHRIQRYQLNSAMNVTTIAGGNGAGSGAHQLNTPYDIHVSERTRSIYIADYGNHRIQRWNFDASHGVTIVGTTAVSGSTLTLLSGPIAVLLNQNETFMYVSDMMNNRILKFQLI